MTRTSVWRSGRVLSLVGILVAISVAALVLVRFPLIYGLVVFLACVTLLVLGWHGGVGSLNSRAAGMQGVAGVGDSRLLSLIRATPDIVCFKDGQGRWLDANPAGLALFRLENVDYRGKTDAELANLVQPVGRDALLACAQSDEAAWGVGGVYQIEQSVPMPDGRFRVYDLIKVPHHSPDGSRTGLIVLGRDRTAHHRAQAALTESSRRYRAVIDTTWDGFWVVSMDGRILQVNDAYCRLSGYSKAELVQMRIADLEAAETSEDTDRHVATIVREGRDLFESVHRRKDGELVPVEISVSYAPVEGGRLFAFVRNIQERKDVEGLAALRSRLAELVYTGDLDSLMQEALDEVEAMTGSVIGFFHFVDRDQEHLNLQGWSTRTLREMCTAEGKGLHYRVSEAGVWVDCIRRRVPVIYNDYQSLPHKKGLPDGHPPLLRLLTVPVLREGDVVAVLGLGNKPRDYVRRDQDLLVAVAEKAYDFVELKRAEDRLSNMAYTDGLTGLPNRALLSDRLAQAMAQHRRVGKMLAVCYLDLDAFKDINDRHGPETGDALLVALAERLKGGLRDGDTIARLSGDEYALLLTGLDYPGEAQTLVRELLDVIERPFEIDGCEVLITASAGITLYPTDDVGADGLLRHADQALYQAKAAGKGRCRLYDTVEDRQLRARLETCAEVQRAIHHDELLLHYQPRVELATGRVVGCEALVRWQHPERGFLYPGSFLPIIEGTQQEIDLGEWVVRQALAQHAAWREQGLVLPVSINISPEHLQAPGFAEFIEAALAYYPEDTAEHIELEVLETAEIGDVHEVAAVMDACIALGLHFSLDDFGTGYSSLTYFRRLPIDVLKIDQNFVRGMLDRVSDLDIVEGVLRLAAGLKRPVVAEGVESIEHGMILRYLGCRYAQGYGIARPMAADRLIEWLAEWSRGGPWSRLGSEELDDVDDLELRVAIFSHRRWLEQIGRNLLDSADDEVASLGETQCQLGRWYQGLGRARYGDRAAYAFILPKHNHMHELATSILALLEAGDVEGARARFTELQGAGDELSELLHKLAEPSPR